MDFVSIDECTYGKMIINMNNIVSFTKIEQTNGLMTRIDTVIKGNPLYVKGDITKDLSRLFKARNWSCTHLGESI